MATYMGSALHISWIQAAATTTLTGDHKSFTYTPSQDYIDASAGADANKTYLPGIKDGNATFNANFQGGTNSGGTTTFATLEEGSLGTVKWSPEGTATTMAYYQIPAYAQGAQLSYPYAGIVEVTVNFQQNGARVEGTN